MFEFRDHVKVVSGFYKGETGLILAFEFDHGYYYKVLLDDNLLTNLIVYVAESDMERLKAIPQFDPYT